MSKKNKSFIQYNDDDVIKTKFKSIAVLTFFSEQALLIRRKINEYNFITNYYRKIND